METLPALQRLTRDSSTPPEDGNRSVALDDGIQATIFTHCPKLEMLSVSCAQLGAVSPELGRLTALTRLQMAGNGPGNFPSSISRLSALRELQVPAHPNLILPLGLTACRQLTKLKMGMDGESPALAKLHSLRFFCIYAVPHDLPRTIYWATPRRWKNCTFVTTAPCPPGWGHNRPP